jgi:ribosomal protein S10
MPDKIYEGLDKIKINNYSKYLHIRNIQLEEENEQISKQFRKYINTLIDQLKCSLDKIINVLLIGFHEFNE